MATGQLSAGIISNREVAQNANIAVEKLQHLHKDTFTFRGLAGDAHSFQIGTRAKVGSTAGWVLGAANNLPYVATMAASQTGGTLVIPIDGLKIGDVITGFKVIAQVESGGNAVTIDGDLRAVTNVAAEPTDASIGTMTQVSVTADTAVAQEKTGLAEPVTSGKSYYLLLTATTLASTDIILQHCEITVTRNNAPVTFETILFVADQAGSLDDLAAALYEAGSSTSITVDIQKAPSQSMLTSTISIVHGTGDRTEVSGDLHTSHKAYVAGDVIKAVVTVTSATGAYGLWIRLSRLESGA